MRRLVLAIPFLAATVYGGRAVLVLETMRGQVTHFNE